ncbi:hypothetical protein HF526_11790 [Pseudonocardia sp. K10HN5]|uniref:Type I restriction modification DNA specificity domain-containing protein n=1 Tax=Pseudonocardia acidicola TaxID=2724939 RepID=A0ABX1S8U7_9PSEU|nr:hypothetical protein [Pseudonocardia acidicola]
MPQQGYEWRKLADLARMESGHTPSRSRPEYWNGGIPWVGIKDATGNHGSVIYETLQEVSQDGIDNSSARVLPTNTVCLSRTASVGYVVVMGRPMATSQDFVNWVCGPEIAPEYLKYILMVEQESIRKFSYGTTHQTLYYPDAKALHVCIPSRRDQDAVAQVLGSLEDKMSHNGGLLRKLDALERACFTGLMAESGGVVPLADLLMLTKGVSYRSADLVDSDTGMVTLKSITRDGYYSERGLKPFAGDYRSDQSLVNGDVVIAQTDLTQNADVVGRAVRVRSSAEYSKLVASLDLVVARPIQGVPVEYILGVLRQERFRRYCQDHSSGTTVLHLRVGALGRYEAPTIDPIKQREYAAKVRSLHALGDAIQRESQRLRDLRDLLLVNLISGRMRVRQAEQQVEAVLQ